MARQRIGDILVSRGVIGAPELARALKATTGKGRLASQVLALGLADEAAIAECLALQQGVPGVDLSRSTFALEHLAFVPEPIALEEKILPLGVAGDRLLVAMANPTASRVLEEIQLISGYTVLPHVAVSTRLEEVARQAYAASERGESVWRGERAPETPALALHAPPVGAAPAPAADGIEIEIDEEGSDAGEVELGSVSARQGPRLVLAVDDEEEILTLVAKALEQRGYRVEKARRGREALDRVAELLPDLVLLDANLPEIHGFDICRKIKSNPRYAKIPVVMMTAVYRGWRFAHDTREAFGVDDYIEKPFRMDDLVRRVQHHLARHIGEPARDREKAERLCEQGVKLLEAGRPQEAVAELEKAAEADAFSPKIQYQLGRALQAAGEAYRAIGAYERSVDLRPDHFAALRSLAALYQQKGFRRKAIEAWERAIPAAPDDATRQKIKASLLALL